jgi:hypothetical protein
VARQPPVIVLSQLRVVALAMHPHGHPSDASPRVHPSAEGVEGTVIGGHGAGGEAEDCREESAARISTNHCNLLGLAQFTVEQRKNLAPGLASSLCVITRGSARESTRRHERR